MHGDCHKLGKDTPDYDLFLCQALFPYGSNQDRYCDVHVYHGNSLPHNNQTFWFISEPWHFEFISDHPLLDHFPH